MRNLLTIFILFLMLGNFDVVSQLRYPVGQINVNTNPGGIAEQIRTPVKFQKTELYVIDKWSKGFIYLKGGTTLKTDSMRYNLMDNYLEIAKQGSVKVLTPKMMDAFEFVEGPGNKRYFVNSATFKNTSQATFFEVLNEGDINLLVYHDYKELPPNYNPALDVGSKAPTFHKEEHFFIMKNYQIEEVPSRKKDFIKMFDNRSGNKIKTFMKSEKLNHKKKDELLKIIEYLNK